MKFGRLPAGRAGMRTPSGCGLGRAVEGVGEGAKERGEGWLVG